MGFEVFGGGFAFAVGFEVRKFPEVGVDDAGGTPAHEKFTVPPDDKGNELTGGGRPAFAEIGQIRDAIFLISEAEFFGRADGAPRIARGANQSAEFHQ